ncbi:uncharacterized protein L3040_008266 [Drepanopeziza brunnea f. sp. 'multigermtubi']|uniref:uncharacterized protein n=1 Tax=Drepanopeziza brunnea f. sp. 'multigermtubi' TaxID=698441 RepID=UPI00238BA293|nr:hypothetical protein L3040_008266 [Drepanopeziza brunnea f. sp. 'multigermtubi']
MKPISRQKSEAKNPIACRKYSYIPLSSARGSFRLVRLCASPDSSWPIRCTLFHNTLGKTPPYVALSYAWGDRIFFQPILVDFDHVLVIPNLKHALQRLRPQPGEDDVAMWIDAICIDQEIISERNLQTTSMRAIYQQAYSVAVSLDMESQKKSRGDPAVTGSEKEERPGSPGPTVSQAILVENLGDPGSEQRKEATMYCGDEEIPWIDLDRVCALLKGASARLESLFYKDPCYIRTITFGGPRNLQLSCFSPQLSRFTPQLSAPPLLELLLSHKSKKASDPKDKVFALVGVSDSAHTFGLIDYSLSMRDVYIHTARHIISISQSLDVICVKQLDANQYELPPWAPDWTRPSSISGMVIIRLHHHEPNFTASGDCVADVQFTSDGHVLKASGFILETNSTVDMAYMKRGAPSEVVPALEAFHDWWNNFVVTHSNPVSAQAVFGRVVSCGTWDHEDSQTCVSKLEAVSAVSDYLLSGSDMLRLDPRSRPRTGTLGSLGNSTASLGEQDDALSGDEEEKAQLSTILSASLTMDRRRLFMTRVNHVGLAPANAEEVDVIFAETAKHVPRSIPLVCIRKRAPCLPSSHWHHLHSSFRFRNILRNMRELFPCYQ